MPTTPRQNTIARPGAMPGVGLHTGAEVRMRILPAPVNTGIVFRRTDLPGGDTATLLRSVRDKLLTRDDAAHVLPGHGPTTTIGRERAANPFLQNLTPLNPDGQAPGRGL